MDTTKRADLIGKRVKGTSCGIEIDWRLCQATIIDAWEYYGKANKRIVAVEVRWDDEYIARQAGWYGLKLNDDVELIN